MIDDNKDIRMKSLEYTNFWLRSIQIYANGAPSFKKRINWEAGV